MIHSDQDTDSSSSSSSNGIGDKRIQYERNSRSITKSPSKEPINQEDDDSSNERSIPAPTQSVEEDKITIRLKPIGSTASINPQTFKVSTTQAVQVIIKFLCGKLKVNTVYMYINNSFQPNPDENIGQLFRHFSSNNELIINYCHTIAFG